MRLTFLHPVLPVLFDDVHRRMNDWGNEGTINPFKELYDVNSTFILTFMGEIHAFPRSLSFK